MLQKRLKTVVVVNVNSFSTAVRTVFTQAVEPVKPFHSIPRPFQLPFLGNWHLYKLGFYNSSRYQKVLQQLYQCYGPIVYERIGSNEPIIHVFDVKDVETVYRNEGKIPQVFPLNKFLQDYRHKERVCPGLGQTNDEEWYRLKNGIRDLMLKMQSVKRFTRSVETVTDELVAAISSTRDAAGEVKNLYHLLGQWSMEGKIVMNKRMGYLSGSNAEFAKKVIDMNYTIFELSALLKFSLPFYQFFKTPKLSKLVENEHNIHRIFYELIDEAISEIEANQNSSGLTFLRELRKQPNLSRDEVIILTSTLFIDPLSTTNPVLINNLFALATNQEIQNKAYKELYEVTGQKNEIHAEELNQLTYLKSITKETFRMYPNGTEVARINKTPLILSNYEIPAGSHLSMNLSVHYRSDKYFSEPNTFKPERWVRGSADVSNMNSYLLSPYGVGARTCAGRRFTDQLLRMSLFKILKAFRLSYPVDGPPIDFVFNNLLFPDKYLPIQFTPR